MSIRTACEHGASNRKTLHLFDAIKEESDETKNHATIEVAESIITKEKEYPDVENGDSNAASTDPGVKYNTGRESAKRGRNSIAAFVYIIVDETKVTNFDGATSLNGLGDFLDNIETTVESKKSRDPGTLIPGTRSGY